MPVSVTLPELGESVTEGTVTRWLKAVGDDVAVDEPLLEVSTDKVDTEIPSPVAGTLSEIKVAEDETVAVGAELAVISDGSEAELPAGASEAAPDDAAATQPAAPQTTAPQTPAPQPPDRQAAPAARPQPQAPARPAPTPAPAPVDAPVDFGTPAADGAAASPTAAVADHSPDEGVAVLLPELGESVSEGTVTRWLKAVGDPVAVDEALLEVSTDKVDTEVPSPVAGTLLEQSVAEDQTVPVGGRLALIGSADQAGQVGSADRTGQVGGADQAGQVGSADRTGQVGSADRTGQVGGADQAGPVGGDAPAQSAPAAPAPADTAQPTGEPAPTVDGGAGAGSPEAVTTAPAPGPEAPIAAPTPSPALAAGTPTSPAASTDGGSRGDVAGDGSGSVTSADSGTASPAPDAAAYVTPLVRRLAAEHSIDLATVIGTGVGGRIRKQDVLDAAAAAQAAAEAATAAEAQAAAAAAAAGQAAGSTSPAGREVGGPVTAAGSPPVVTLPVSPLRGTTEKMSRMRRLIATRMVESLQTSAQLTSVVEVDVTSIATLRQRAKASFERREGVKLSFLPFFAVAVVEALKAYPKVNATIDTDAGEIIYAPTENLGVAVDTERGLMVPVIHDAGDLNLAGIARRIADLALRTRTNAVKPDELSGGTFTLTNTGSRGALFDTPILNQPQVAILGTGAVVRRPVVLDVPGVGETIAIRSMVYLALTYDHRLVDGADAARFLVAVKKRLEDGAFAADVGL